MPSEKSTALRLGNAGLNNAAALNAITDTLVGMWDLKDTSIEAPEESAFLEYKTEGVEGIVGDDGRVRVQKEDFKPGGKYRSIVKLSIRYAGSKPNQWAMGTGWLIKPDLLVTAGHCVFDWQHKLGRVEEVKAYIGYSGRASVNTPDVQFRKGARVASTAEWLRTKGARSYDVGFIKVSKPFTGVTPIRFADTPKQGADNLGVVGYPGDLRDEATREPGAHMYEMFLNVNWDLEEAENNMLQYEIDTFGGNSGSPVLRQQDMVSIGAHVLGGSINSASVIGSFGNPYNDYIDAFDMKPAEFRTPGVQPVPGLTFVCVPTNRASKNSASLGSRQIDHAGNSGTSRYNGGIGTGPYNGNIGIAASNGSIGSNPYNRGRVSNGLNQNRFRDKGDQLTDESFFSILRNAISIGAPILGDVFQTALPLALGPIGAPIGALASIALAAAGKHAESSSAESYMPGNIGSDGAVERAILGEAALAAVMTMKRQQLEEDGILHDMAKTVKQLSPTVKQVSPHVMGTVTEPALRIALDSLKTTDKPDADSGFGSIPFHQLYQEKGGVQKRHVDLNTEAFVQGLITESGGSEGEEGWFDSVGDFFRKGISVAAPILSTAVNHGLPLLARAFGQESATEAPASALGISLESLGDRAVLGEAALQAVMRMPKHRLEEEGFFTTMFSVIKRITPIVLKAAPKVIQAVMPIVDDITSQKSAFAGPQFGPRRGGKTGFKHQREISHANIESELLSF